MKNIYLLLFFAFRICSLAAELPPEGRQNELAQVNLWKEKLESKKYSSNSEKLSELWLGLRSMGTWKSYDGHGSEVDILYLDIQNEILSIPGHAQYFFDELEKKRLTEAPSLTRERYWYIADTLCYLPSPETIKVLGNYLADDRNGPKLGIIPKPGGELMPTNSSLAKMSLDRIGLRNFKMPLPEKFELTRVAPDTYNAKRFREEAYYIWEVKNLRARLAPYRAWWDEVKSGRKTFSFKGQSVEYRFKPDGTWDTIPISNPPDDGTEFPKPRDKTAPENAPSHLVQPAKADAAHQWWPWLWIPALAIIGVGWRIVRRRSSVS